MRNPFMSMTIARIAALAPFALVVLTLLALVLSASADFAGPDI